MSLSIEAISERYATSLKAVSEIAQAYFFQGRLDEALRLFQEGEPWLSAPETLADTQLDFLLKYGKFLVHHYFLRNSAEDLTHSVVQRARQAAEASQDQSRIALSLHLTGQELYYDTLLTGGDDFGGVRAYFEQSSALREKNDDRYHLAESLFYTGLTYDRKGPDERSKECYQRALSLAEQYGNKWAASEATRHLTDYTDGQQRWYYARQSLVLREEAGLKVYVPSAHILLGNIALERGNLAQAQDYCRQAEQLCREMNLPIHLVHTLLMQSELASRQGDRALAREKAEEASRLAFQLNSARETAAVRRRLERL